MCILEKCPKIDKHHSDKVSLPVSPPEIRARPSLLPPALGGANRAMYLGREVLVPIVPSLLWRGAV